MRLPSENGVSSSANSVVVGRLPSKTRWATWAAGPPSAATSSSVRAERQRLGLREQVRHEQVVVSPERVQRPGEADEVARDQPRALVDQLVEGVLAVGARLAPDDRAGVVVDGLAREVDVLAVRLHVELLR